VATGCGGCATDAACYPEPVLDAGEIVPERLRPLRRNEYDRLVEDGLFGDERIELLEGVLVEMTPSGATDADVIGRLTMILVPALVGRALVRVQSPLAISNESEPEPDLAIVAVADYQREHPRHALLVVEVAEASLRKDLGVKATLYARARVGEYWVVDLSTRTVRRHAVPTDDGYTQVTTVGPGEILRPDAFPDLAVPVDDVLPR
jgi:Uma2 family endonuclease